MPDLCKKNSLSKVVDGVEGETKEKTVEELMHEKADK